MKCDHSSKRQVVNDLATIAFLGCIYIYSLLPGIGYSGDSAKFDFVGRILGTPHTSGYPLYMVLNHIFVALIPFGTLAYRANLLSAVFAVVAVLFLRRVICLLGVRPIVAFSCALMAGVASTFWSQAIVAEVYALNALFVAATLWAFLRWEGTRRKGDLYLASAIYALSFGNHLTMVTLLPAVVLFVFLTDRTVFLTLRSVVVIACIIMIGALQYSYIFWRTFDATTPYLEMATPDLKTFWWYVTGAQFKGSMFAFRGADLIHNRIPWYFKVLVSEYLVALPVLGLVGARRLSIRQNLLLLGTFVMSAGFAVNYNIVDIQAYFIPSFLIVAVYIALGLESLIQRLSGRSAQVASIACLLLPVVLTVKNLPAVSQRENVAEARRVEHVLASLGHNAVVVTNQYDVYEFLQYYLLGEGLQSRGLFAVHVPGPDAIRAHLSGRVPLWLKEERKQVPTGLPLVCVTTADQKALASEGFRLVPRQGEIWEVRR